MTLALVDAPSHEIEVASRLDDLRRRLEHPSLDFAEALDVRDQAATVRAYVRSARLGLQLANQATEAKLRAERKAGLILLEMSITRVSDRSENSPAGATLVATSVHTVRFPRVGHYARNPGDITHQSLPRQTLRDLGISGKDSSRYQQLARIEQDEFDARISATVAAGRQLGYQPFWRAAAQYRRQVSGRPTTPAASLLSRALRLLKDVSVIRTPAELELARQVVAIGASWNTVVNPPPPSRAVEREVSCLLCGRGRPASRPPACPSCGGRWLEA